MELFDKMVKAMYRYARASFIGCHYLLAAGSTIIIFSAILFKSEQHGVNFWLAAVVAYVAANVWYQAIEDPLKRMLTMFWAYRLTDKESAKAFTDNHHRAGKLSGWLSIVLVTTTLSLSMFANFDITEGITFEQDSTAEISQSNAVTSSYDKDVDLLREQLDAARTRDAERVKAAKAQAAEWVKQAEGSKGAAMLGLMKKGNDWAKGQLRGPISKARAKGERHIADVKANAEAPTLQGQLTGYVTARSASRDTVATMTAGLIGGRHSQYINKKGRRNLALSLAVLLVTFIYFFSAKFYVVVKLATNNDEDEQDGPGVVDTVKRMAGKLNQKLASTIESKYGDKLVLIPVAATRQPVAPPQIFVAPRPEAVATTTEPVATTPPESVADTATTVVGQGFEAVAASCSPEDIRRYKDKFRQAQVRQHTSATQKGRDDNRAAFTEAVGVLSAFGYGVEDSGKTYRQTHKIDGKARVVTFKLKQLVE